MNGVCLAHVWKSGAGTRDFVTYWWSNGCYTRCAWPMFGTMGRAQRVLQLFDCEFVMKMHVPTVRHGAVRGNGVFSGRNVQLGLTHPEKPAYSRMIMENQKGFARHRSWQIRQPSLCSSCPRKHGISWINSNKIDFCP